jgi:AcrR family transcriptional regulator
MKHDSLYGKPSDLPPEDRMTQTRTPRADSVRNRSKILAAARDQISAHGPEVGMSEIAGDAGVAVGTLYRHFPTKSDLVAAVIGEYVDRVAEDAEDALQRVIDGASAFTELTGFLARVVEATANVHAVKAVAGSLGADEPDLDGVRRATEALSRIIDAAQARKQIRADLTIEDVYLLMGSAPLELSTTARQRWLALVTHGLRDDGSHPRAAPITRVRAPRRLDRPASA